MSHSAIHPHNQDLEQANAIYQMIATSPANAWKYARKALKTFPKSERIQFVSGLAQIARGKKKEARVHFANAIKLGSASPDAYTNLAQLSAEVGLFDSALKTLDRADKKFGRTERLLSTRIAVLRMCGKIDRALATSQNLCEMVPNDPNVMLTHGLLLADNAQLMNAIRTLEHLSQQHPEHVPALLNLGRLYALTNQGALALQVTKTAFSLAPNMPECIENLALRYREQGAFSDAAQLFQQLTQKDPAIAPEAFRQLSDIAPLESLQKLRSDIKAIKAGSFNARAHLEFALAGIAKRLNEPKAFTQSIIHANRNMAKLRSYDADGDAQIHSSLRLRFRQEPDLADAADPLNATPIFIMGLPRSGTTLLERMLSMAPNVAGLGEVALLNRHFAQALAKDAPFAEDFATLRAQYAKFQNAVGPAQWTVDKMPSNYMSIGWINRAFPNAKLIVLRRDPKDLALSIFENYFDDASQNFSFEEKRIQAKFALFEETLTDWRALDAQFLEINYEDLVAAPNDSMETICTYCGLPFEGAMLTPQANTGTIRTVSSVQARQGITQDSIARWTKYPNVLPRIFNDEHRRVKPT
ncbi:tetratricopeptide repeat-containing sulfotransferase family protein [Planktotalea sp.]|uniref:tetratricopeptide repeat-containing sulfotransferase family protein n=1 Tax=Planktotalea sp. TaxID=2029877 RepID=UPI003D6B99F6